MYENYEISETDVSQGDDLPLQEDPLSSVPLDDVSGGNSSTYVVISPEDLPPTDYTELTDRLDTISFQLNSLIFLLLISFVVSRLIHAIRGVCFND